MGAVTTDATGLAQFTGSKPAYGTGDGWGRISIQKFHVDMSAITTALGVTISGGNADILQMWDIPVGTHIISVMLQCRTAEGAAATVSVGDATSAAGFLAASSINSATATYATGGTDAFYLTAGKVYAATDTLDLTFGTDTDIDTAVFDVYVLCAFYNLL